MYCSIQAPTVKDENNKDILAPLYKDLTKYVSPSKAAMMYQAFTSDKFKNSEIYPKLELDQYGDPTISSLAQYTNLLNYTDLIQYGNQVSKKILGSNSFLPKDCEEFFKTVNEINKYNNENKNFHALLIKNPNTYRFELQIVRKNEKNSLLMRNQYRFLSNAEVFYNSMQKAGFNDSYILNQIKYAYNVYNSKGLDPATLNSGKLLDQLNRFKSHNLNKNDIESLTSSQYPSSEAINTQLITRMTSVYKDNSKFIFNYLQSHGLIDDNLTLADVQGNLATYIKIVRDHLLMNALSNSFSLSDINTGNSETNKYLFDKVDIIRKNIIAQLNKINVPDNIPTDNSVYDTDNIKKDISYSIDVLLRETEKEFKDEDNLVTAANTMEKLINAETKRYNLAIRLGKNKEASKIKDRISNFNRIYDDNTFNASFISFMKTESKSLKTLYEKMQKDFINPDIRKKSFCVREVLQQCDYYKGCIEYFENYINNREVYIKDLASEISRLATRLKIKLPEKSNDVAALTSILNDNDLYNKVNANTQKLLIRFKDLLTNYVETLKSPISSNLNLSKFKSLIDTVKLDAQKKAVSVTADFLKQFQTEKASYIPWGDKKGEKIDIESALKKMDKDINFYDLYLDAMVDCPDVIMRLTDKGVKMTKSKIRLQVQELAREIKKEAKILENSGIKGFNWLYKKDENGRKTGLYITKEDPEYASIAKSPAKLRFYNFFMKTKSEIDNYYPTHSTTSKIIGIRKDRLERLKEAKSNSFKDMAKEFKKGIEDNWIDREDDDDIAGYKEMFTDIAGNEVELLPIYYNNVNENNADEMSEDAVSTLIAYANKGIEYHNMQSLIVNIELEKEVLKLRQMPVMSGSKKVVDVINRKLHKESKEYLEQDVLYTPDGGRSNAYKRFESYIDMTIYGKFRKDEGNIGKFSKAKIVDQLNKKTAIAAMSLNLLNGISNVVTGVGMTRIESICGQFFNIKDMAAADAIYAKELMPYLGEKGNRIKDSKLSLFLEEFDVLQEYENDINETNWIKDNWFKRICSSEYMSVVQNAGEHYLNTRVALAYAHSFKLKTKSGKETNLWEILDTEYLQEDGTYGPVNKKLGARFKLKEPCFRDDKPFELNEGNMFEIVRKMAAINQSIHGIYNKQDANVIQSLSVGRLIYMFRKWIPKSLDKRFAKLKYNYDLDEWTEGYYRTTFNFIKGLIQSHNALKNEASIRWSTLDERQKHNIIRALIESASFIFILMFNKLIMDWDDDDDKENYSLAMNHFYYQCIRYQSERAALSPISFLAIPWTRDNMLNEFSRLLKSPMAAATTVSDGANLLQLFNPFIYSEEIKRGPWKGWSKPMGLIISNKFAFPYGAMLPKNSSPADYASYYLQ